MELVGIRGGREERCGPAARLVEQEDWGLLLPEVDVVELLAVPCGDLRQSQKIVQSAWRFATQAMNVFVVQCVADGSADTLPLHDMAIVGLDHDPAFLFAMADHVVPLLVLAKDAQR